MFLIRRETPESTSARYLFWLPTRPRNLVGIVSARRLFSQPRAKEERDHDGPSLDLAVARGSDDGWLDVAVAVGRPALKLRRLRGQGAGQV